MSYNETMFNGQSVSITMVKQYKKQFQFIKDNNIVAGKTRVYTTFDGDVLITFINPFYGWIGTSDKQINIDKIKRVTN